MCNYQHSQDPQLFYHNKGANSLALTLYNCPIALHPCHQGRILRSGGGEGSERCQLGQGHSLSPLDALEASQQSRFTTNIDCFKCPHFAVEERE